ncbi:MAG: DUF5668 domain-containing protein [Bryobacteraceae bacterium]
MNRSAELIRAIRGPVMLITLGALLAADRFSGVAFTKTWPVLLIVFGLMKLLERTAAVPGAGGETRFQG